MNEYKMMKNGLSVDISMTVSEQRADQKSRKLEVALSQNQQLLNHLLAQNTEINIRFLNMPPFPHLHNTAIYERRNNWSLKSSEGKKTLTHSLPSAAQHASRDLSAFQSPTQGMTPGLSFYYIARHRMLGVMTSNKDDCRTYAHVTILHSIRTSIPSSLKLHKKAITDIPGKAPKDKDSQGDSSNGSVLKDEKMYFILLFGRTECFLLGAMTYDWFAAICHPLSNPVIIIKRVFVKLVIFSWISKLMIATV
ncbi:hypothetical protein ACRRTK_019976 [Alexandromys fortis]